jgi:hypothetical protein
VLNKSIIFLFVLFQVILNMKILAQTKSFALSVNGNIGISHFEGHENNSGLGSCASIGIRSTNRLGKLSYSTGINYKYIQISNFNNSLIHQWENELIQTKISSAHGMIEVPLLIEYQFHKLNIGIGVIASYMIHSIFNQHVRGYYPPDWKNESVYFYFQNFNDNSLSVYNRYNFAPTLEISYAFSKSVTFGLNANKYFHPIIEWTFKHSPYNISNFCLFINHKIF